MYIGNDKITFNFTQINSFQNIIIKELESVIVFGLQKKSITCSRPNIKRCNNIYQTHILEEVFCFPWDTAHERTLNQQLSSHDTISNTQIHELDNLKNR